MKPWKLSPIAAALVAVVAGSLHAVPSTATAAAKPGFAPGIWRGTATMSGASSDGPMTTTFSGKVRFTLAVKPNLAVSGSGTWTMIVKSRGPVSGVTNGTTALTFTGSGSDVRYAGVQKVAGTVSDGINHRPIGFTRPIKGRFAITRAGTCKVVGTAAMGDGRSFKWSAVKGTGTCL
jgi:hypothetical protein